MCARRWRGGGGCKKNRVKSADSGTKVLDPCCIRSLRGTHDVVFVCVHGCLGVWARAWYLGGLGGRKKTVCFARPSEHSWRADIWWETEKSGTKKKSREGKRERVGLIIGTKVIWGEMHRFTLWRRWSPVVISMCAAFSPPKVWESHCKTSVFLFSFDSSLIYTEGIEKEPRLQLFLKSWLSAVFFLYFGHVLLRSPFL